MTRFFSAAALSLALYGGGGGMFSNHGVDAFSFVPKISSRGNLARMSSSSSSSSSSLQMAYKVGT